MNVFEKYLDNIAENAKLYDIITQLCYLNLINNKDNIKQTWGKEFIKLNNWEINIDEPDKIIMFFDVKDSNTGTQYEYTKKIPWNNLLIKVDGYE